METVYKSYMTSLLQIGNAISCLFLVLYNQILYNWHDNNARYVLFAFVVSKFKCSAGPKWKPF
jgi:hypothetical protein